MKRFSNYLLLCLCLTLCTSCFEVLEEITLNTDGSGNMLVTFNLSKSKSKLASIMLMDSINGRKVPSKSDIREGMVEAEKHLKTIKGISNIKKTIDFENYIFTLSCDFSSVENLDNVFKDLIQKNNKRNRTKFNSTSFTYNTSSKNFKRSFTYDESIKKNFNKLSSEDREIFDGANFTSIYRFKNTVKSVSNPNAKVSANKKAVFLKVDAMSLILNKKNIANTIQLSN